LKLKLNFISISVLITVSVPTGSSSIKIRFKYHIKEFLLINIERIYWFFELNLHAIRKLEKLFFIEEEKFLDENRTDWWIKFIFLRNMEKNFNNVLKKIF